MKVKCPYCGCAPEFSVICGGTQLMLSCNDEVHNIAIAEEFNVPGADARGDIEERLLTKWVELFHKENNNG